MAATLFAAGLTDPLIDLYNLTQPIAVEHAHRRFAEAGAELLTTNTERANPLTLARHHIAEKTYEINRKGVWLARAVANDNDALVAVALADRKVSCTCWAVKARGGSPSVSRAIARTRRWWPRCDHAEEFYRSHGA